MADRFREPARRTRRRRDWSRRGGWGDRVSHTRVASLASALPEWPPEWDSPEARTLTDRYLQSSDGRVGATLRQRTARRQERRQRGRHTSVSIRARSPSRRGRPRSGARGPQGTSPFSPAPPVRERDRGRPWTSVAVVAPASGARVLRRHRPTPRQPYPACRTGPRSISTSTTERSGSRARAKSSRAPTMSWAGEASRVKRWFDGWR